MNSAPLRLHEQHKKTGAEKSGRASKVLLDTSQPA